MDRKRTTLVGGAALAATAVLLSACSGPADGDDEAAGGSGPVELTINVFGDSFPEELYAQYEEENPGVTITENRADYGTHHNNLQARLAAGSGTADVELIEVGQIAGFIGQADRFVNFLDEGVDTSQWNDAKIQQASTPDGESLIGLGTDIGGLAICYRTDLFEQAGLPTDRDEVSALWPTWDDYVATGSRFLESAPDGVSWMDGAGHLFTGMLGQEAETFYDTDGEIVVADNPVVREAWDLSVEAIEAGQSAALAEFSPEWNTGFQRGQFATITCPSWMTAYIRNNAPETEGLWDIATVPGGSGNWGGSFLTVPAAGENVEEAVKLARWLAAPEQAVAVFETFGNFPSPVDTWDSPAVAEKTDPFFNDAPVGTIFPASFESLPPQVLGPQSGVIGVTLNNALNTVEKGEDPDRAWQTALDDIAAATAG
ncbi:MAG: ABC transporter substrate-binding protein [Actinomycetes bacterium]